jgi:hypothetical protein
MAKAHVVTLEGNYSDIVLGRVVAFGDTGWNFEEVEMAYTADLVAGLLVAADGTPAAAAADVYGVLVDRKVLPGVTKHDGATPMAGETLPMTIAVRGLTLNASKLVYADGSAIDDAGKLALSKAGNQVTDRVVATEFLGAIL